ncbi:MAG: SDR family oxidoreductase [Chitinophagaceae bacterium]|nr:SDR family oxidoreductase [Chitinophagaceae bacterium]
MLLTNKNAIIYGGGGAIGGAVAMAFAREGATVFLAGRRTASLETIAHKIMTLGGKAEIAIVNALDKQAVDDHLASVIEKAGRIDISFNAIGVFHIQGIPLTDLTIEDFNLPISVYTATNFLTATAAARHMIKNRSGVILTISTPGALMANGMAGGFGLANAAVEGLTRQLAGELGPHGIRAVCLRPDAIPEAAMAGSHTREVFDYRAKLMNVSLDELFSMMPARTLLQRFPTLSDVAETAVFLASDKAGALTATVANLSCGSIVG